MKILVFALLLYGCGGEAFTTVAGEEPVDSGGAGASSGGAGGAATGGASQATGGTPSSTGGVASSTGGAPATGGALETGGTSTGGSAGGGVVDACALVTHDNGLRQTWQDCVPLGTYNAEQAVKACQSWCAVNNGCTCLTSGVDVLGNGGATTAVSADGADERMLWLWKAPYEGDTMRAAPKNTPYVKIGTWI